MSKSGTLLDWSEQVRGIVPDDWDVGPLSRVLKSIDAGRSPNLPDRPAQAGEWGVLKVSAIRPDGFREVENKAVIQPSLVDPAIEVKDGDLLISRANTPAFVGLSCYVRTTRSGLMLSDKTLRLNVDSKLALPEFINYLLQLPFSRRQIEASGTGSSGSMKNIGQDEIRSLILPLPGVKEQNRLAGILNTVDELIQSTERLIAKLEQVQKGLLRDLLIQGIDESGRLRDLKDAADPEYGAILSRVPRGWSVYAIGESCSLVQDGTHLPPPRVQDGPLLLSVRNMVRGELLLTDADARIPLAFFRAMHRSWKIEPGDVCLAVVGATVGKLARVGMLPTFTIQRSITVLRGRQDLLDNDYLYAVLSTPDLQRQIWSRVNQTAQPGIYLAELRKVLLPVPPLKEQRYICERLSVIRVQCDSAKKEAAKLRQVKRGLMNDLLTGRVRVGASE